MSFDFFDGFPAFTILLDVKIGIHELIIAFTIEAKGWLLDILLCVERIQKPDYVGRCACVRVLFAGEAPAESACSRQDQAAVADFAR